jgi:hypothetical protein
MAKPVQLDEALLEAVDFGLLVPGEIVREAIYERLETVYGIKREELASTKIGSHQKIGHGSRRLQPPE